MAGFCTVLTAPNRTRLFVIDKIYHFSDNQLSRLTSGWRCVGLDRENSLMRRILFAVVLTVSLAGAICAQEVTGAKAEAVKKEIMKIEDEKVAGLLRGGSEPVDWIVKYDAEDIAQTNIDGSRPTKAQVEAGLQPGVFKMHSMKQDGHRIRVYDDGNVAVVTYHARGVIERNGKAANRENLFTDVWVKQKGAWLRVVHQERDMPKQ
jgi:ketosteroid isomerase-like protein